MYRIVLFLFIFCHAYLPAGAQDQVTDSLEGELSKAGADRRRQADICGELALKTLGTDVDKAQAYGRKAIDLARSGNYQKELARSYVHLGLASSAAGNTEAALALADSAWRIADKNGYTRERFFAQTIFGNGRRKMARYDEALSHYMHAARIAEEAGDRELMGRGYSALGVFYVNTNDLDRAELYHRKALAVRLAAGDDGGIYQSYNNLGILNREKGRYNKALEQYFRAEEYARKLGDSAAIAFLYNDIGAAYSFSGQLLPAERYLKESIAMRERMNERSELAYTYNYLGENYERKKDLTNAEAYIRKALAAARETHNNKQTYEALESLSDFFARNGRYDSAYVYIRKHKHFKDSITRIDQGRIIAELNARFETAKKEKLIQDQEHEISKRNYWIAGITGILLMGTSLGINRYKRNRLKQRARLQAAVLHQQELATRGILEAEENERRRIATDLHDGVGQMMSAAKLNLSSLRNDIPFGGAEQEQAFDNALSLVDESCREVRNVSHNIMPNALLKNGLASAIRTFINKIDSRVIQVNLYSEGLNDRLDSNIESVLYRVVQECVNNVIRHAAADKLDITLIHDSEGVSITIEDNGKGFELTNTDGAGGMGLKNIRTRIGFLKGTVEWDSAPGKGTVVMIHTPV